MVGMVRLIGHKHKRDKQHLIKNSSFFSLLTTFYWVYTFDLSFRKVFCRCCWCSSVRCWRYWRCCERCDLRSRVLLVCCMIIRCSGRWICCGCWCGCCCCCCCCCWRYCWWTSTCHHFKILLKHVMLFRSFMIRFFRFYFVFVSIRVRSLLFHVLVLLLVMCVVRSRNIGTAKNQQLVPPSQKTNMKRNWVVLN